jgi:hypothetical protein
VGPDGQELGVYDDDEEEDGDGIGDGENDTDVRGGHGDRVGNSGTPLQLSTQQAGATRGTVRQAGGIKQLDDLTDMDILNAKPAESSGVAQLQKRLLDRFTLDTTETAEQGTYKLF